MVKRNMEAAQARRSFGGNTSDQRLRRYAFALGLQHDRRAMSVVGAHKVHLMPREALESDPDVCLDVLHDMPQVERSIGIGQRGRDK